MISKVEATFPLLLVQKSKLIEVYIYYQFYYHNFIVKWFVLVLGNPSNKFYG